MNLSSGISPYPAPKFCPSNEGPPPTISQVKAAIENDAGSPLEYVGGFQQGATIGVLDSFRPSEQEMPRHGDEVHAVILRRGFQPEDVQKINNQYEPQTQRALTRMLYEGDEPFPERLDAYIEQLGGLALARTNEVLEKLSEQPDLSLKALNISHGESRLGLYSSLRRAAFNGWDNGPLITDTGRNMARACGLDPEGHDFTSTKLYQALLDRVDSVVSDSPYLAEQQQEHSRLLDELRQKGVVVFSSAGNDNDEWLRLRDYGYRLHERFDDDFTSVGQKIIVGALDDRGTPDPGDDVIAEFSSRYPAVKVLAPGVGVATLGDRINSGTSFAAPLVLASYEQHRRAQPELPLHELEALTLSEFRATDGFNLLP